MKSFLFLLLFTGSFQLVMAQDGGSAGATSASVKNQNTVPAFNLQDMNGKQFNTATVRPQGKTMALVYFSPTCGHCMAFTEDLTARLKEFKDVQFLFISAYPMEDIKTFALTRGLQKMPNFKVGCDPEFKVGKFYDVKEIPAVHVYDKSGKLKKSFDSKVKIDELKVATNG